VTKTLVLIIYTAWVAISLGGVGLELYTYHNSAPEFHNRLVQMYLDWHSMIFNPAASMSIALSLLPQVSKILWYRSRGSLSISGLCSQVMVFSTLACSWRKRLYIPDEDLPEDPHLRITAWFNGGGWAVVDSALFSIVQGLLLLLAVFTICMSPRRIEQAKSKPKPKPKAKSKPQVKVKAKSKAKARAGPSERSPLLPHFVTPDNHGTRTK
jgi:hypothetical protein